MFGDITFRNKTSRSKKLFTEFNEEVDPNSIRYTDNQLIHEYEENGDSNQIIIGVQDG